MDDGAATATPSAEADTASACAPSADRPAESRRPPRKERKSSRRQTNSTSYSNFVPGAAPPPPPARGRRGSSRTRAPPFDSDSSHAALARAHSLETPPFPFPFNPFAVRTSQIVHRAPFPPTGIAPPAITSRFGPSMTPFRPGPGAPFSGNFFGPPSHFPPPPRGPAFSPFGPPRVPLSPTGPSGNPAVVYVPVPVPVYCPTASSGFVRVPPPPPSDWS